ncbi:chromosome segregation protein SMC [Mycobacterium asiaticum]|nr:chromosome segregation protein SMC [Mycobacterium asiaticum]
MYINQVRARAFGPLRSEDLELGPGLNVVHGPNEAGKSSWFAATYSGLAGRRKFKGRGTTAEADFKNRHKPWSGSRWAAGVTVTLDSGLTLRIEQDLARNEAKIVDGPTGQTLREKDLEKRLGISIFTDSTLDGTRLLGLNRDSARATVFTGQADILRVLADANELQELLERAASTEGADATADGALCWLDARRKQWVGSANVGSKPLRANRAALDAAKRHTSARRDELSELLEAIGNRHKLATRLQKARDQIELADRFLRWRSLFELRDRVEQAQELSARLAASNEADLVVDDDKVQSASARLGAFDSGSDISPLPSGPSAADLQAEIEALPGLPDGDLEPRSEVEEAQRKLADARTALTTHMQTNPREAEQHVESTLSPDQLRTLADVLTSSPPQVDAAAIAEFERRKTERAAQLGAMHRASDEAAEAYERAKANYDAAVLRVAHPHELTEFHDAERVRADEFVAATGRQVAYLNELLSAQEAQAEVMAQDVALRQHREAVDTARERVLAESLMPDPAALRLRAREIDDAEAAQERARQHAQNAAVLRSLRDDHARTLARLLGREAPSEISDDVVAQTVQAFDDYVAACKARAAVAQLARRRPDLEAARIQRLQLESTHEKAMADRASQGRGVVEFASGLGLLANSAAEAAESLRLWVGDQETKREALTKRREDIAALNQLLNGRKLADLQTELARSIENVGPEPDADAMPPDLEKFHADAISNHDMAINLDGQLKGRIQTLSNELGSVAEASEVGSDAERAVAQVETLAACLDEAISELNHAKSRAHASIAPALQDRMRPWLPRVTNCRYLDVTVEPSDLTMQVTEASGQKRQADRLSHGTTEQMYLLLRVTLSEVLSGGTETAPLILDDVTTQSDSARTVAVLELLHEISTEHQVILFTQEDEVVAWAEKHCTPDRDTIIGLSTPGS